MSYTAYLDHDTAKNLYAKPRPLVASPWSSDVITLSENGTTGEYSGTLDETLEYVVYERAGGSPASSDLVIGAFGKNYLLLTYTAVSRTVNKVV